MLTDAKIAKMEALATKTIESAKSPRSRTLAVYVLRLIGELRGKHDEAREGGGTRPLVDDLLRRIGGPIEDLVDDEIETALNVGGDMERELFVKWLRSLGENGLADRAAAYEHEE